MINIWKGITRCHAMTMTVFTTKYMTVITTKFTAAPNDIVVMISVDITPIFSVTRTVTSHIDIPTTITMTFTFSDDDS